MAGGHYNIYNQHAQVIVTGFTFLVTEKYSNKLVSLVGKAVSYFLEVTLPNTVVHTKFSGVSWHAQTISRFGDQTIGLSLLKPKSGCSIHNQGRADCVTSFIIAQNS